MDLIFPSDRGLPQKCLRISLSTDDRADQVSEFVFRDMDLWARQRDVVLNFPFCRKPT